MKTFLFIPTSYSSQPRLKKQDLILALACWCPVTVRLYRYGMLLLRCFSAPICLPPERDICKALGNWALPSHHSLKKQWNKKSKTVWAYWLTCDYVQRPVSVIPWEGCALKTLHLRQVSFCPDWPADGWSLALFQKQQVSVGRLVRAGTGVTCCWWLCSIGECRNVRTRVYTVLLYSCDLPCGELYWDGSMEDRSLVTAPGLPGDDELEVASLPIN